ncbi:hypothetical protein B7Y94_01640 [Candidatus Saccharibacteria bacterium 32-49-12]|nr:MAG: hypothetical protein B7Y94_01640 [Candidatus Saccharibacteria bacterium 32-49-12]
MYRKPSRNKELARRIFIYLLMTVVTISLVGVLMLRVLGYQFNFETQTVEQTGLMQYNSYPRGARVIVDGRNYERTQTKGTVLPGQRQFAMELAGYESWQKTLDILPGTVTWLNYIRLVPVEKNITEIEPIAGLSGALTSPDRRFMAGISSVAETGPALVVIDFRDSQRPAVNEYLLDQSQLGGFSEDSLATSHKFSVTEWNRDSRTLIIKHNYTLPDGQARTDWLWVDRENPQSLVNLSSLLNLSLRDVQPLGSRDAYILQSNGDLRHVEIPSGTLSRPLISQVTWFDVYQNDTIAYIGWRENERTAGVWKQGWAEPTVLASSLESSGQDIRIQVSRYFNKDTVALSIGSTITVYRGALPATDESLALFLQTGKSLTLNRPLDNLQISGNGRLVVAEDANGFISYDLERQFTSQGVKKYSDEKLRWIDSYYVWQIDDGGKLLMQEFDGVNSHQLMPAAKGYDVLLTQDSRYIYSFSVDGETVTLQRLSMTI